MKGEFIRVHTCHNGRYSYVKHVTIYGGRDAEISNRERPLMAQSSPSGLTLDCPVLGSKLQVNSVLINFCNWQIITRHN
jgi:hypothetical protein